MILQLSKQDKQKLRDELKLGKLLIHKNRCNNKKKKLKTHIMDEYLLLKQHINVDSSICKYKIFKLSIQQTIKCIFCFVYLNSLKILIKKVSMYIIILIFFLRKYTLL